MSGKAKDAAGWSIEADARQARKDGFTVIWGKADRLLVDLDSAAHVRHFEKQFDLLKIQFELVEQQRYESKTAGHLHVVIGCQKLPAVERIGLQAVLGSDRKREALALLMLKDGVERVSVLFKPPNR